MKKCMILLAGLALTLLLAGAALAGDVAQGKCLSYNKEAKTIAIEEFDTNTSKEHPYGKPTGITTTFDVSTAKIGLPPESGDVLRIAYLAENSTNKAVKVMNVTKQSLKK